MIRLEAALDADAAGALERPRFGFGLLKGIPPSKPVLESEETADAFPTGRPPAGLIALLGDDGKEEAVAVKVLAKMSVLGA